jgi:hypothetical protein
MRMSERCLEGAQAAGLPFSSSSAVALELIPGILQVAGPKGGYAVGDDGAHIRAIWPADEQRAVFFGKNVLDNWAHMTDTKGDTLYRRADGSPIFLDASHAFRGEEWGDAPWGWADEEISPRYGYLEGIVDQAEPHRSWLTRVTAFGPSEASEIVRDIPEDWGIPRRRLDDVRAHVGSTAEGFVPVFERWLDWLDAMGGR